MTGRARWRSAPLRRRFVRRDPPFVASSSPPPLATLARTRGGDVRVKVFLSLLWIAAAPPYDATLSDRTMAELVGVPTTPAGLRRVAEAVRALESSSLVAVERVQGRPRTLRLLDDGGTGAAYIPPGAQIRAGADSVANRYVRLPAGLFVNGWLPCLDGPALTTLLVLLAQGGGEPEGCWISATHLENAYGVSQSTWYRGVRDLRALALLRTRQSSIATGGWRTPHFRGVHRVDLRILGEAPSECKRPEHVDGPPRLLPVGETPSTQSLATRNSTTLQGLREQPPYAQRLSGPRSWDAAISG